MRSSRLVRNIALACGVWLVVIVGGLVYYVTFVLSDIDPGQFSILLLLLGTSVIVTLLAMWALLLSSRLISRSSDLITEATQQLVRGHFELTPAALHGEETQELAHALNQMAHSVRGMFDEQGKKSQHLTSILDTMTDAVIVVDGDNRIELLNPSARKLLELSTPSPVGMRFNEAVRDHEIQNLMKECLGKRHQVSVEVDLLHSRRSIIGFATPLSDGAAGVLFTMHDRTVAKELEATRREFVANVSHELRSPIASIKAMAETLEEFSDDRVTTTDFIGRIRGEVDRMTALVEDLLDLAKLQQGRDVISPQKMDMNLLLENVVASYKERASVLGINLEVRKQRVDKYLIADQGRLRQVLVNLLENALRFTGENGTVVVEAVRVDGMFYVHVKDSGIGIPIEHLPHVFERFYKADRSRREEGSGLGLAIVKHIVQAHGGEVEVKSVEGEGSTFSFGIPCMRLDLNHEPIFQSEKS